MFFYWQELYEIILMVVFLQDFLYNNHKKAFDSWLVTSEKCLFSNGISTSFFKSTGQYP